MNVREVCWGTSMMSSFISNKNVNVKHHISKNKSYKLKL